jgi:hypothetical protein
MQYEYLRIYLNHNLLCPNCNHAFMVVETGFPSNGTNSPFSWSTKPPQQRNHSNGDHSYNSASRNSSIPGTGHGMYQQENTYEAYNNQSFQLNQYPKTTGSAAYGTQTLEKTNRKHEVNHIYSYFSSGNEFPSGRGRHSNMRQNINNVYASVDCNGDTVAATVGTTVTADAGQVNGINVNGISRERYRSAVSGRKSNVLREIFQLATRGLLIDKAKAAIHEKLQDVNISKSTHLTEKREAKEKRSMLKATSRLMVSSLIIQSRNGRYPTQKMLMWRFLQLMKTILNRSVYLCTLMSQIPISMILIKIAQKEFLAMIKCGLHMIVKMACLVYMQWCRKLFH